MTLFATWSSMGCWSWPSIRTTPVNTQTKDITTAIFLISSTPDKSSSLGLWPLLEHFLDALLHCLLILVPVVAQRILGNSSPNQRLGLGVEQIDNQGPYHVLLRSDATHSSAEPAHAHRGVGSLFFHATAGRDEQVRFLVFLHLLQTLALQGRIDVLLCHLSQDRILDLVGVVGSPCVGVIWGKTLAVVVVDRNCLSNSDRGRD